MNIVIWPKTNKINLPDNPAIVTAAGYKRSSRDFELKVDTTPGAIYQKPKFPGGLGKFINYISRATKYPNGSLENEIEGTVTVEFIISKTGEVISPKIINSLDKYCDQAVIKALKGSPRWVPTIIRGKPIATAYQLDVVFKFSGRPRKMILIKSHVFHGKTLEFKLVSGQFFLYRFGLNF